MYQATKKTRAINAFKRMRIVKPRDLYARYGERVNPKAIHGTTANQPSTVVPPGQSVIGSMVSAQELLRSVSKNVDDNPP